MEKKNIISPISTPTRIEYIHQEEAINDVRNLPVEFSIPYPFTPKFQNHKLNCFGCMMAEWYETVYSGEYRREFEKYLMDTYRIGPNDIEEQHRIFSTAFSYGNRDITKDYLGKGAVIRQQLQHCQDEGMVLSMEFDSDKDMPDLMHEIREIKPKLLKNASFFKIKEFKRLKNLDEVKLWLYNNKTPIIASINLYSNFMETGRDGIVPFCDGVFQSKHGLLINGWRKDYMNCLNSYGKSWGDNGYAHVSIYDEKLFSEFWAVIPQDHLIFPEDVARLWRVQIFSSINRELSAAKANEFMNTKLTETQKFILNTDQNYLDAILVKTNNEYRVQVGAFKDKEDAFKMVTALEDMGYNDSRINIRNPISEIIEI